MASSDPCTRPRDGGRGAPPRAPGQRRRTHGDYEVLVLLGPRLEHARRQRLLRLEILAALLVVAMGPRFTQVRRQGWRGAIAKREGEKKACEPHATSSKTTFETGEGPKMNELNT